QIVDVPAELHIVAADRPGKVVAELVALFDALNVGVRLAPKISESRNVYRRVRTAGNLRIVKVRKAAAGILKAEFIDLVVADCPRVLKCASYVAVGLLRSARVSVLPEGLVLAADLDAGDGAWANVASERQAMVRAQVVIKAERV